MYAYIDIFRNFGKTNTDNQSIKVKKAVPIGQPFFFPSLARMRLNDCGVIQR